MTIKPMEISSQNALDKYSSLTVSSGEANKNYLFDDNTSTYWQGENASDTYTETVIVEFKDFNQNNISIDIDRLILQNTNIKYLTAQAVSLDQTVYDIITTQAQNLDGSDIIIDFTPLSAGQFAHKVILYLHTTQTPNEKKQAGEIKLCKKLMTLDNLLVNLSHTSETSSGNFRTVDGTLTGWRDWTKFAGELSISNITYSKKTLIEQIYRENDFITLIHFNDENINIIEASQCHITQPPDFLHDRTTNLYETILVLKGR